MKFEKISENKLKIKLDFDELPESSTLKDFMSDTEKARQAFLDILACANEQVGFDTSNYKIRIDAKAMIDNSFVFEITKLLRIKNKVAHPKRISKMYSNTNYSIYKFQNFEDFCNFCLFLKKNNVDKINSFSKLCRLFKYYDNYYLTFEGINQKHKNIAKIYSSITEFSKFYSGDKLFVSSLEEKGKVVFNNNAILIGQVYFT